MLSLERLPQNVLHCAEELLCKLSLHRADQLMLMDCGCSHGIFAA